MILQKLYDDYNFEIEQIIFKEHRKLNLTTNETIVLMTLFSNKSKVKVFSIQSIVRKVDFNKDKVSDIVTSLMEKGFVQIELETNNDRSREIYKLDNTFKIIEDFFNNEKLEELKDKNKSNISKTISLLEEKFGRILRLDELDRIKTWYENFKYEHEKIIDVINSINKGITVLKIEKILSIDLGTDETIDPEVDAALERIYKRL